MCSHHLAVTGSQLPSVGQHVDCQDLRLPLPLQEPWEPGHGAEIGQVWGHMSLEGHLWLQATVQAGGYVAVAAWRVIALALTTG
jgi:hypothetical protein